MAHKYWHIRFLHKLLVPSCMSFHMVRIASDVPEFQFATKFRGRTESGNEASLVYM